MGVTTDGQICFGVIFEEGYEFPWDSEDEEGDVDYWWFDDVCGYKPTREIYGDSGRLPGVTDEDVTAHYAEKRSFEASHPMPFVLVNACSGDCPVWILAVPGTELTANRGYPITFDPASLRCDPKALANYLEACKSHGIELHGDPQWILSSYWG